jgi:putative endonuclease
MTYYVYSLYSPSLDIIYIGQTNNLEQRVSDHKRGYSKFTSRANDWILIYKEKVDTRGHALKREKQLKSSRGRSLLKKELLKKYKLSAVRLETDQATD